MSNAPLSVGAHGADVARLQNSLIRQGYQLPESETSRTFFGPVTRQAVQGFQQQNGLNPTGELDAATAQLISAASPPPGSGFSAAAPSTSIVLPPPGSTGGGGTGPGGAFVVTGTVSSNVRSGLSGLRIVVVDKNAGPDIPLAQAFTGAFGVYQVSFSISPVLQTGKTLPDLQARVYAGDALVATSDVRYNATSPLTLNIILPDTTTGLPSEHESLTAALTANYKGSLANLQESGDRQDITYLANKTSWDARAVAMAALAAQFSAASAPPTANRATAAGTIPPEFYYALFRAGLPANPDTLHQTTLSSVKAVWEQGIAQGVIPSTLAGGIGGALQAFQTLSANKALTAPPSLGLSTMKDLLNLSLPNNPTAQQQFASLYTQYQEDLPSFWAAAQKTFGAATAQRLQLDGQLGYLTLNNASLIAKLHQTESQKPIAATVDLAMRGYHRAAKWLPLLMSSIPSEIPGANPDEQRANYAELLATHVRLAYPTAVMAEMVGSGAVTLKTPGVAASVSQFLTDNQGKFEIGTEPVEGYVARNQLTAKVAAPVVTEVKRLQRVYQITPNDQALTVLLQNNLDSAYAVTRYDSDGFVRTFAEAMGGTTIAQQTYAKARQVHGAVINIAASFMTANIAPQLGQNVEGYILNSAPQPPASPSYPIVAYPTLEGLLGSMDFCACDECRSIMGPAAYMVNLLEYINCLAPQSGFQNPQMVLFTRRPDLQYLPLTCENTNIALPYIDLVNEIMEYFVANNFSITNYQGHDTGSTISSDELMASPQYVNDTAYAALQAAWFPPPLPFHRPLALLRLHFQKLGVPLGDAMTALRPSDAMERGTAVYGWRDILMEQLGLSRAEYRILTDSTLKLQDLYGYPALSDAAVISNLSGLQDFSRRTGVSYEDIFAILQTRFINPFAVLIPKLQQLNVPFTTLRALKNGSMTPTDFKALLPAGLDARQYGGATASELNAVVTWATDSTNYAHTMALITISNPVTGKITLGGSYSSPLSISGTVAGTAWNFTTGSSGDLSAAASGIAAAINASAAIHAGYVAFSAGPVVRVAPNDQATDQSSFSITATSAGTLTATAAVITGADLCSSVDLQFRYSNPDNTANVLQAIDFVRLIRFIRLWRKLGLSIEQTDDTITAFYPAADLPTGNPGTDLPLQDAGFLAMLPRIGFLFQVVNQLQLTVADDLAHLLACWSPIGVSGSQSLYAAMFLTPTVLETDPAFAEDGYGNLLQDSSQTLLAPTHVATLRAAFNLTATEFALIAGTLGYDSTTVLTLPNISAIYRVGWMARTLQISIVEFLLLTRFTGLDPFALPDPSPTAPAEPPVVRFIRLAQGAGNASLQPFQTLYLMWNQDISGLSTPPDSTIMGLAATLRADFTAVEQQFLLVDDPNGDIAKSLMELVYGATATDFFLGLLNNTVTTSVAYGNPQPSLAQPILDAATGRLSYDDLGKQLAYGGVLDAATLTAVQAAITANGNYPPLQAAMTALSAANHQLVDPFFSAYPELGPGPGTPYGTYVASSDPPQTKRTALLANLLADLKSKRKQEQALAAVTAAAGIDPSFGAALLGESSVMNAAGGTGAAVTDLTSIEAPGLSAQFFLTNNTGIPPDQVVDAVSILDYQAGGANPLPPGSGGSAIAAIWSGYLSAPQDGDYNLQITTDPGAVVTLTIGGSLVTLVQAAGVWSNSSEISLIAGSLASIVLSVTTVKSRVTVSWESKGMGWQVIPAATLYSATALGRLRATYIRFLKVTSLASALSLTANETAWLAQNPDLAIGGQGWLNALAVTGDPASATWTGLRDVLMALLDYARIKKALSPKDERFLNVLQNPAATGQNGNSSLLTLTGWSAESRDALLQQFFGNTLPSNLAHVENFRRLYDAYTKITTCGIAAAPLIAAATNDPTAATVTALQSALRALYAESDWLAVIKPINDTMRDLQRDALAAYILQQLGDRPSTADVNTPDKLFEFFLVDVLMEPCMQTSRIRHALSSIQLFAERCLRNLEPSVAPSDIAANRWDVMKRYRLWQANLEVFLWPERWLYPELRDDQSEFFQSTTKQLLQSDITDDSAAVAYLDYLTQLEAVAQLEPCAIYYSPADPSKPPGEGDEFAHVIARTPGTGAKYYYRRLNGGSWTPWADTKLNVEDNPMAVYVWDGRLLVFWLRILAQHSDPPPQAESNPPGPDSAHPSLANSTREQIVAGATQNAVAFMPVPICAVLCWSEFYNGKWQPTKTSDINNPTSLGAFDAFGPNRFDRSKYQLKVASYSPDRLVVSIRQSGETFSSDPPGFLLYNTHSVPPALEVADNPNWGAINWRWFSTNFTGSGGKVDPNVAYPPSSSPNTFSIDYTKMVAIPTPHPVNAYSNDVLQSPVGERVLAPQPFSDVASAWNLPFFFQDSRNLFYVTTSQAMVPLFLHLGFASGAGRAAVSSGAIAGMVVPPVRPPRVGYTPVISAASPPVSDPGEIRRFVTEDAYIRSGIAVTTTIAYQGTQIGPRGSLPATQSVPGTQNTQA